MTYVTSAPTVWATLRFLGSLLTRQNNRQTPFVQLYRVGITTDFIYSTDRFLTQKCGRSHPSSSGHSPRGSVLFLKLVFFLMLPCPNSKNNPSSLPGAAGSGQSSRALRHCAAARSAQRSSSGLSHLVCEVWENFHRFKNCIDYEDNFLILNVDDFVFLKIMR